MVDVIREMKVDGRCGSVDACPFLNFSDPLYYHENVGIDIFWLQSAT